MSDKRLLKRCGTGKGYLNETRSGSVRPPGLRIRRAGARTKGSWYDQPRVYGRSQKTGNVLSAVESQGFRE